MTRIVAILLCAIFPFQMLAEVVVLRSGEHVDFSRIVVQFNGSTNWEFGKVSGGYELRTDATAANFDFDRVFDLIPRRRITGLSELGPGRIFFAVSCECQGDAFEIRKGRLVIDIKDGVAESGSQFNSFLAALTSEGAKDTNAHTNETHPYRVSSLGSVALSDPTISDQSPSQNEEQEADTMAALTQFMSELRGENQTPIDKHSREDRLIPSDQALAENEANSEEVETGQEQIYVNSAAERTFGPWPLLPTWPAMPTTAFSPILETPSTRFEEAESALLLQLSRAAAQGLLRVELPEILEPLIEGEPIGATEIRRIYEPSVVTESLESTINIGDHLRLETAVDRGVVVEDRGTQLNSQGAVCLDGSLFEIGDWGPVDMTNGPFSGTRNGIVQEFDTPNSVAIEKLAKRYLFLGFGAELKQLLRSFSVNVPDTDILLQMGEILEINTTAIPGRLERQISCPTPGAMWAVLALGKIPAGAEIDAKAILRAFSSIPPHLRRLLGPRLVDRFLEIEDLTTAQALRKITDRAAKNRDRSYQIMSARIASYGDDTTEALRLLEASVKEGGSQVPLALAEVIEIKIEAGIDVDEKTVLHADALAFEYRGTEIGRRLTKAAICGFTAAAKVELTFERISQASESNSITAQEAKMLYADAQLKNAQSSPDARFLAVVYQYPPTTGSTFEGAAIALRTVAARLVQLGLPGKASQFYNLRNENIEDTDRRVLAAASLEMGRAENAVKILAGLEDREALQLLARAKERLHNYTVAAEIYTILEMEQERESALWRAQNLQLIATLSAGPRTSLAKLVLNSRVSSEPQRDIFGEEKASAPPDLPGSVNEDLKPDRPIAYGKELLVNSAETRNIIAGLLESSDSNK